MDLNGVTLFWWNDKHGNPQYFWSGNNASAHHTSQCGIDSIYEESLTQAAMSISFYPGIYTSDNDLNIH